VTLWVSLVAAAIAVAGAGLVALDYTYWSVRDGMLAEDDFWDRCRSSVMRGELALGRYEGVVWMKENDAGVCEEVRGYCVVNEAADGTVFGDSFAEHQVTVVSDDPSNCTYVGVLFDAELPFKRVE
jgi:hypothetical protein